MGCFLFKKNSVSEKINFAFLLSVAISSSIVLIYLIVGIFSNVKYNSISNDSLQYVKSIRDICDIFIDVDNDTKQMIMGLLGSDNLIKDIENKNSLLKIKLDEYKLKIESNKYLLEKYNELDESLLEYYALSKKLASDNYFIDSEIKNAYVTKSKEVLTKFNEIYNLSYSEVIEDFKSNKLVTFLIYMGAIFLSIIMISGIYLIGELLCKDIDIPLSNILKTAKRLSKGNLTVEFIEDYSDEFGSIGEVLNTLIHSLRIVVRDLKKSVGQVNVQSKKITDNVHMVYTESEHQENIYANLNDCLLGITEKANASVEVSKKTKELMLDAKNNAINGNRLMSGMLKATQEIYESSLDIKDIIGVIDDISFQTSILALNATIESARAGAQGKGFTVVANEVRNLASRSGEAVKVTKRLIETSIERAEVGSKIATQTSIALDKIMSNIMEVNDIIAEVSVIANEQAVSVDVLNSGVNDITKILSKVKEISSINQQLVVELCNVAKESENQVLKFKLNKSEFE